MNWTLEVIQIPVSDVDSAIAFYRDQVGFILDFAMGEGEGRLAQLTPPGSGCSIQVSRQQSGSAPGTVHGMQLVVSDLRAARRELIGRGVDASPIMFFGMDGVQRTATDDDDLNNSGFVSFTDPDGARWAVQQITDRP
ncbi:VOC family protein [Euzebya tangerina]|uniref:VOC family protein n=1 Tax=Euzebya tangerina TaxID=591198 RepID=UPI000E322F30|nr:VOC family protein [Euzebya tangerina]